MHQHHRIFLATSVFALFLMACEDVEIIGLRDGAASDAGTDGAVHNTVDGGADAGLCDTPNLACPGSCAAIGVVGTTEVGRRVYAWDGADCAAYTIDAGACTGAHCASLYDDQRQCRQRYAECIPRIQLAEDPTCGLTEVDIVNAAVRLNACGVEASSYVLHRFYSLETTTNAYAVDEWETTIGCADLRCARNAGSCASLEACLAPLRTAECAAGPSSFSCSGDALMRCERDHNLRSIVGPQPTPHIRAAGTCAAIPGGSCRADDTGASCVVSGLAQGANGHLDYANGDDIVFGVAAGTYRLRCADYLANTAPRSEGNGRGDSCAYRDATCSMQGSPQCNGNTTTVCAGGHPHIVHCLQAGYSGCEPGRGCVGL